MANEATIQEPSKGGSTFPGGVSVEQGEGVLTVSYDKEKDAPTVPTGRKRVGTMAALSYVHALGLGGALIPANHSEEVLRRASVYAQNKPHRDKSKRKAAKASKRRNRRK